MRENKKIDEDENVQTGAFMPLVSLRQHYKIGLILFCVIFVLGLPYAWFKGKAIYSVTAVVYVAPHFANILKESREQEIPSYQQFRQFIEQQTSTINRYDIVFEALEKLGERRFVWQEPDESLRRAAERLQGDLKISQARNTYLITVALEGKNPDGLDEIVNMVVQTYVEKIRHEELFYASDDRLKNLSTRRDQVQQLIAANKQRRIDLSQELGVTTFVANTFNPHDKLLSDAEQAHAQAQRKRLLAEANLRVYESDQQPQLAERALDAAVAELIGKDQGLFTLKANLYERKSRLLQEFSGLNKTHPLYHRIKKQLDDLDSEVTLAVNQLSWDFANMLLEQRHTAIRLAQRVEDDLQKQIDLQKKQAAWFAVRYNEGISLSGELKRYDRELGAINDRINFLSLESQAPGFIRMDTPARKAEIPTGGGRKKLFIVFVILAVFAGLGVPIIIDMFDKRIRTSGQVKKIIRYEPLAEIFEDTNDVGIQHFIAYQKRRLLLALQGEFRHQSSIMMLLTSVKSNSCVTSLAFDLAREFSEFNISSIVVELNPVKPDARYYSIQETVGVLNLINDPGLAIEQAIKPAENGLPDRIALGMQADTLLYGYARLEEVLADIKKRYTLVILDTAPILLSADTEYLIGLADMSLLLIAALEVRPGELKRAVHLLEKADPALLSFIVTRLRVYQHGGYYQEVMDEYLKQAQDNEHIFTEDFQQEVTS